MIKEPYTYENEDGELVVDNFTPIEAEAVKKHTGIVPNQTFPEDTLALYNKTYGTRHGFIGKSKNKKY